MDRCKKNTRKVGGGGEKLKLGLPQGACNDLYVPWDSHDVVRSDDIIHVCQECKYMAHDRDGNCKPR